MSAKKSESVVPLYVSCILDEAACLTTMPEYLTSTGLTTIFWRELIAPWFCVFVLFDRLLWWLRDYVL